MENETQNQNELSKKEKWEQRKEERTKESSQAKRKKFFRSFLIWGGMLVILVGVVYGLSKAGSRPPGGEGELAVAVTSEDWSKGVQDPKVTLVEYGDFQCPACGAYYGLLKQLTTDYGNDVKFVFRHFPLTKIHANAELAAKAAEAAGLQGKFWEMHNLLFENQNKWSKGSNSEAETIFTGYAQQIGLNVEKFKSDLKSSGVNDQIKADYDGGVNSKVTATPTFYVNGIKINNPTDYEAFKTILDNAIKSNN